MRTLAILFLLVSVTANAAIDFPKLTGRVVDNAGLISSAVEKNLVAKLAGYEQSTTNQVVIVTLKSLQGYTIEDFGYQLGRHWGIGLKEKNNGVLLIVAPKERKVRIEVGYGLEGTLTDAYSHNIIQTKILPLFKQKQFEQGIVDGTDAIIEVLGGSYQMQVVKEKDRLFSEDEKNSLFGVVIISYIISLLIGAVIANRFLSAVLGAGIAFTIAMVIGLVTVTALIAAVATFFVRISRSSGYWGGSSGSGGFGGGGFSGGGGGFGGGGASGGW